MEKVWLVGAGPSDIGLLTLRGMEVLQKAQVVVYDALVGQSILNQIPREAECISVGKRAGCHTMPQEEISRLLYEKAREGKRVVRLKGGDPFLFGRGGEELELLAANGIPFEVVPGVTSAISVPAYNGIPVTHRDHASSLHIITGHKRAGEKLDIDFQALVRAGGTDVFLMGYGALPEICRGLLQGGMDPNMPAALLMQGTSASQKKILSTVSELPEEAARQETATPAIIVVGEVCRCSREFSWYEKLPLFGHRIVVTRPRERAGTLSSRLRELGAEVLELPAIATVPMYEKIDMEALSDYDYLVFTSPTGVQVFWEAMARQRVDVRSLWGVKLAAIGPGTARELENRGLLVDVMPTVYDTAHLGALLGELCRDTDKILIPRASMGSPRLIEEIRRGSQAAIVDLPIYDTVYEGGRGLVDVAAQVEDGEISMAVFTSGSTVRGFARANPKVPMEKVRAVCIGPQTGAEAASHGMQVFQARQATMDSLVECVLQVAGVCL